ncbi:MAG: hypothetical protein MR355_09120 [Lachnospiraceae bacterium]|nr:hypothetical protein [Lachnospiraceae bacterium]
MIEPEMEEENREDSEQGGEERRERPHMTFEERIRRERQAKENYYRKKIRKWAILFTILLILFRSFGFHEAYALYASQNTDFYHVIIERPKGLTPKDLLSRLQSEAGANSLMLFGMVHESENDRALLYGQTVDIYCSESVKSYLEKNQRMKEGTCYGFLTGRVDVVYHDFSELAKTDLSRIELRAVGPGKGVVQFTSGIRSFCDCEFWGGGDSEYKTYQRSCLVILCVVSVLICALWLFYYLYFVRHVRLKMTKRVVFGGVIAVVLLYGAWWQIGVRLAYGKYQSIAREKGLYSSSFADVFTGESFSITEPDLLSWDTGLVIVSKPYGDDCDVSLIIKPKFFGAPEYELCLAYMKNHGTYCSWDQFRVKVNTQMEPIGDNDLLALAEYERNYELLCDFWERIEAEGWLE